MTSELLRLDVGGTDELIVFGKKKWNMSGLSVVKGQRYAFTTSNVKDWRDASVKSTPEGQIEVPLMLKSGLVRRFRRFQGAEWYALVGCVQGRRDWMFKIGKGVTIEIEEDGELAAFANDASLIYWNNHGSLRLGIKRCG